MKSNLFKKIALVLTVFVLAFAMFTTGVINTSNNRKENTVNAGVTVAEINLDTWKALKKSADLESYHEIYIGNSFDKTTLSSYLLETNGTVNLNDAGTVKCNLYNIDGKKVAYVYGTGNIGLPKKCYGLFKDFNATKIEFDSTVDTSKVENMMNMFYHCTKLTSLNLSNFDTSNVITITQMFENCISLKSLNVATFDVSKIKGLYRTFYGCEDLESLDVSSWNTSNVTDFRYAFSGCISLKNLDLTKFSFSSIKAKDQDYSYIKDMLLHVKSFKIDDNYPFDKYTLVDAVGEGVFDIGGYKATDDDMQYMASLGKATLIQYLPDIINMTYWNDTTGTYANAYNYLKVAKEIHIGLNQYALGIEAKGAKSDVTPGNDLNYLNADKTIAFKVYNFGTTEEPVYKVFVYSTTDSPIYLPEDCNKMFFQFAATNIYFRTLTDTSYVISMRNMFMFCQTLTSLDLRSFDTSKVVNMNSMFWQCTSLTELDLRSFNTLKVTDMGHMFQSCTSLTSLDLSKFDTSKLTQSLNMFMGCSSLTSLDLSSFDTSSITNMANMFLDCSRLIVDLSNFVIKSDAKIDQMLLFVKGVKLKAGSNYDLEKMLSPMAVLSNGNEQLFVSDIVKPLASDMELTVLGYSIDKTLWNNIEDTDKIKINEYDEIYIGNSFYSNELAKKLKTYKKGSSGISDFYTIYYAAFNIEGKKVLYIYANTGYTYGKYDIYLPADCSKMFNGFNATKIVFDSSVKTNFVTNMSSMFANCNKLTTLDVSNFDTSKVTNMNKMFFACYEIAELNLNSFDTSEVIDMSYMFYNINKLTALDVSNFDTSKVTNMADMFASMYKLTALDVSNFNTSNVTNMSEMFRNAAFEIKGLENFLFTGNSGNPEVKNMLRGAKKFTIGSNFTKNLSYCGLTGTIINDGKDNYTASEIQAKFPLTSNQTYTIVGSFINDMGTLPTNTINMIRSCDVLYVGNSESFKAKFDEYRKVSSLSGSGLDASGHINIYLLKNVPNVGDVGFIRSNINTSLVDIYLPADSSKMFSSLNASKLYFDDTVNTSYVTIMDSMFSDNAKLTELDLSIFDTSKVTDMHSMFNGSKFTSLDLSNFNTSNVTTMKSMFKDSSNLESINVKGWDVSKVTNTEEMFNGCSKLKKIDLTGFNFKSLTSNTAIFYKCTALNSITLDKNHNINFASACLPNPTADASKNLYAEWTDWTNNYTNTSATNSIPKTLSKVTTFVWHQLKKFDMSNVKWDYTQPFAYDGTKKKVSVTGLPEGLTVKAYYDSVKYDAGKYTASVSFEYNKNEYEAPVFADLEWEIFDKLNYDMSNAKWTYTDALTYNGNVQTITVTGLPEGVTVKAYTDNAKTEAGTYVAKVTFNYDSYKYNVPVLGDLDWTIEKATFDMSNAKWNYVNPFAYDGNAHKVEVTGLPEGVTASYTNNEYTNAGSYTAKATLSYDKANYNSISINDLSWAISKVSYDMTNVKWDYTNAFTYDGKNHIVAITGLPEGVTVKKYTGNEASTAGTYTATVVFTFDDVNYNDVQFDDLEWTINKANYDMSKVAWDYTSAFTYDGTKKKVALENLPNGVTVKNYFESVAFDAGTYTATASFYYDEDNYNAPELKPLTWVINKATIDMSKVDWNYKGAFTYNGQKQGVELINVPAELTPVYNNNYNIAAGYYTATVTFDYDTVNYNAVSFENCDYYINKAVYDVSEVTFDDLTVTYDTKAHELTIFGTLPDGLLVEYTNNVQTNAGTYEVTVKFVGDFDNYEAVNDRKATLTIEKATIDMSEVQWNYSDAFTYDGKSHSVKLVNLPELVKAKYTNASKTDAGTYTAKVTFEYDTDNYNEVTFKSCKWTINKAVYDMTGIKFNDDTVTYDGLNHLLAIEGTLPEGVKVSYENNMNQLAGTYTVTAKFAADTKNHEVINDMTATLVINKATYDMSAVKFENSAVTYDAEKHSIHVTGTLPEGVKVTYTGNANVLAGEYEVVAKFEGDANYNAIPDMKAKLTINKAKYNMNAVTFSSLSFVYDGTSKALEIAGTLPQGVTVAYTGNGKVNAGTYTVVAKFTGDAKNYEAINDMEATITIVKNSYDMSGAKWDYTNAFTYDGLDHTVQLTGLPQGVTAVYTNNVNSLAGTYTASVTFKFDETNYIAPQMADVTYVINKALVTEPTEGDSQVYTSKELTSKINGTELYDVANVTKTEAGTYDVVVTLKDNNNYKWATGEDTATRTLKFAITQADNAITGLTIKGWVLGETASTPSAKATFGTIQYFYGTGEGNFSEDAPKVAGTYLVMAVVEETKNFKGATATFEFIVKNEHISANDKNESGKENVVVSTKNGLDASVKLDSKTTDVANAAKADKKDIAKQYKSLDKEFKTKYNEEVKAIYSITLYKLVNGQKVELQPTDLEGVTELTVKFLLPADVDTDKLTRILHVHGEQVTEIEFNKDNLDEEGYYTLTVSSFSDYAFVGEKKCLNQITLVVLTFVYIAFVCVCFFVLKKRSFDLVTIAGTAAFLVVNIVLTFLTKCSTCIWHACLNYFVCALGACFFLFYNKLFGHKEEQENQEAQPAE